MRPVLHVVHCTGESQRGENLLRMRKIGMGAPTSRCSGSSLLSWGLSVLSCVQCTKAG